jgi:hypothetical protein
LAGSFPHFIPFAILTEDEGPERIEAAFGKGLERLAEVKAKWYPQNVFRTSRNIKPDEKRKVA